MTIMGEDERMDFDVKQLVEHTLKLNSELENVEVKAAKRGAPDIRIELSSLSNRPNGGVIIFGVEEKRSEGTFNVIGVYNVDDLQKHIVNQGKDLEPVVRPEIKVEEIEGKFVLAAKIPECDARKKSCFIKARGMWNGSFIRVGDSDERMTDYEIYNFLSYRGQAEEDLVPVEKAKISDLNLELVEKMLENIRRKRPRFSNVLSRLSFEEQLERLSIAEYHEGKLVPTLGGLLVFGEFPQQFFPSLCITFLLLPRNTVGKKGDSGERFLDNQKIEGNLLDMIEDTEALIRKHMTRKTIIEGFNRMDVMEYPEDAVREAVINALVHRDYSSYKKSEYIQVRMFPNRLEIENPGKLYGDLTVDKLLTAAKARNELIIQFLEDLDIIENRGSGIDTIIDSVSEAQLAPPVFEEARGSFRVTFNKEVSLPIKGSSLPHKSESLPHKDGSLPIKGGSLGHKSESLPHSAEAPSQIAEAPSQTAEAPLQTAEAPLQTAEAPPQTAEALKEEIRIKSSTTKKVKSEVFQKWILQLCEDNYQTRKDLVSILNRQERTIAQHLSQLIKEKKIGLKFPNQPSHPKQAYRTTQNKKQKNF